MESMEQRGEAVVLPIHSQVRRIKQEDEKMIEEKFKIHMFERRGWLASEGRARLPQRSRSPLGLAGRAISVYVGS